MSVVLPVKSDGDVPIPQDVRERLRWDGAHVVLEQIGDAVVLRLQPVERSPQDQFDWDRFRVLVPRHEGEVGTRDTWNAAVEQMFAERGRP